MIKPLTIEAGKRTTVSIQGRFFRCREASDAFQLIVKSGNANDTYTIEGGDEFAVRDSDQDFKSLTFVNLSEDAALTVDFFAGRNVVKAAYVKLPRTRIKGNTVNLANNAEQTFSGIDTTGKRRKQFTITARADFGGYFLLYNADTNELLAIVDSTTAAGVGFAIETDCNIKLVNKTGDTLNSTDTPPDICVAETFYR